MQFGLLGVRFGRLGASGVGGGLVYPLITLDMQAGSDSGSSSTDNITTETEPVFDLTFGDDILEGDLLWTVVNGEDQVPAHEVDAAEALAQAVTITAPTLSEGSNEIKVRGERTGVTARNSNTVTVTVDATNPTISSTSPVDGATGVTVASSFTATFDDNIVFGTGSIFLKKTSDDSTVEEFAIATDVGSGDGKISIASNVLTINPTDPLDSNTGYYILIDATAIDDVAGNSFAGIAAKTVWNWTSADAVSPTIDTVAVTSSAGADNTYKAGDVISVTVTFDESVEVTGTPQLTVSIGGSNKTFNYASGDGTTDLVFSYTVQAGDTDTDGISIAADSLALNGGTIQDSSGNNATLTHSEVTAQASHKVDTTAPVLSSPSGTETGATTADLSVATDTTAGTIWVAVTTSGTPPSVSDLKAGTGAAYASSDATPTNPTTFSATGLTAETEYWAHFYQEDAAGNGSSISTSASFTTDVAASFAPDDLANMVLWIAPDDITTLFQATGSTTAVTAGGQTVGTAVDKSGTGNLEASGNDTTRPTYQTTDFPHINFDGSNDKIFRNSALGIGGTGQSGTIAFAIRPTATTSQKDIISEDSQSSGSPFYRPTQSASGDDNDIAPVGRSTGGIVWPGLNNPLVGDEVIDGTDKVIVITDTGSQFTIRVNGSQVGTQAYTRGATALDRVTVGCRFPISTTAGFANFRLYQLCCYSDVKTGTDLTDLEDYLMTMIGL